jgi:Predicted methyltransferase
LPGYDTRIHTLRLGDRDYRIRSLSDLQQYDDPDGHAERAGISSAQWSLFGQVWPAGQALARVMATHEVAGKRILELGCGLGLASLVLSHRGADVVASDVHPLAETFLAYNAGLNDLPAVTYRTLSWQAPGPGLDRFDMIIASDVLYERDQAGVIAGLVDALARPACEVVLVDPGRGHCGAFARHLKAQGFAVDERRLALRDDETPPYRGRLLLCRRAAHGTA